MWQRELVATFFLGVLLIASPGHADYVTPTNVLGTSEWSVNAGGAVERLIDGSGLDIDSPAGLHDDASGADTMWHGGPLDAGLGGPTGNPPSVADQALVFDLGGVYDLTAAYVWQHNQYVNTAIDAHLNRGVDEFEILVSADDVTYTTAGVFYLPRANPDGVPDHQEPATTVTFSGMGRYVKFDIHSDHSGSANDYVGLSEVRFDGTLLLPANPILEIDRATGAITLSNDTGDAVHFVGYSVFSETVGALNPAAWTPIADSNGEWLRFTSPDSRIDLSEGTLGDGVTLASGSAISFGPAWIRNPAEDVEVQFLQDDGSLLEIDVRFTGNDDQPFAVGDIDFNGNIDSDDWDIYRSGQGGLFASLSAAEAYHMGDLDGDLDNDLSDFLAFEAAYDATNGPGSFAAMLAGVPEPSACVLLIAGGLLLAAMWHTNHATPNLRKWMIGRSAKRTFACLVTASTVIAASVASAEFTLTNPVTPTTVTANSEFSAAYGVTNLFDDVALTGADMGVRAYTGADPQYAGVGMGPMEIFMDFGSSVEANHIAFAQRVGGDPLADKIGQIELWFSDSDFAGVLPGVDPSVTVSVTNLSNDGVITPYAMHGAFSGQYVAMRMTISDQSVNQPTNNIGGNEFRLAVGPADLVLQVNTTTGATAIRNDLLFAQALDLNGYQISSALGSLDRTGWNSLEHQDLADFPAGDGTGSGWEEGDLSSSNMLIESYLTGFSTLPIGGTISLGNAFDISAGVEGQDLVFEYTLDGGPRKRGIVEYVVGPAEDADFDQDGDVDGADLLTWQRGYGGMGGLAQGDANGDGQVDADDLAIWQTQYGPSGVTGGLAAAAVPEPATGMLCLVAIAIGGLLFPIRRGRGRGMAVLLAALVVLATDQATVADVTNDRAYWMGEDDGGVSGGNAVSYSTDSTYSGQDLNVIALGSNSLIYVDTTGRPMAEAGELGIQFNGMDQAVLDAARLGNPSSSANDISQGGFQDYSGIANRGFQLWVNPAVVGGAAQDIVMDTNQHGLRISADGTWVMVYANGTEYDSGVTVTPNQWYHAMVVRPYGATGPNNGARLYIDGNAVAAAGGGYNGEDNFQLVVGGGTYEFFPDAITNPFTGIVDDLELFVMGTSTSTGTDYGTFDIRTDNPIIAAAGPVDGDLTGDGLVMGDGSGGMTEHDDVGVFVEHWLATNLINGIRLGDLNSRNQGDFNFDGRTDILDWHILRMNHVTGAAGINLGMLLAGSVPEPAAMALCVLGLLGVLGMARISHGFRRERP